MKIEIWEDKSSSVINSVNALQVTDKSVKPKEDNNKKADFCFFKELRFLVMKIKYQCVFHI